MVACCCYPSTGDINKKTCGAHGQLAYMESLVPGETLSQKDNVGLGIWGIPYW